MVIRFTKATRFLCVCALLLLTALISIGTKSISVSIPYAFRDPLPVVLYRYVGSEHPVNPSAKELQSDLAYLKENGYTALSEQELVAALRLERPLPANPVLLLFDDSAKSFSAEMLPLLQAADLPWLPLSKSSLLSSELQSAGYPVTHIERVSGFSLEEQLAIQ